MLKFSNLHEYYKQENAALRLRLDALRAHLIRQSGESPDKEIPIPDSNKVMGEWVKGHLAGRRVLLPRAERAASKAEYTEVGMVYQVLLILANEYRDPGWARERTRHSGTLSPNTAWTSPVP